jgi:hypothetical protein
VAGPLIEDLRLGRPEATPGEVSAALATVGATGWVDALPDGLETPGRTGGGDCGPGPIARQAYRNFVAAADIRPG